MHQQKSMSVFLHAASNPLFLAKGLYAGLKSRSGLATPLPLTLVDGDDYVNTGFIDSLPTDLLSELEIDSVDLWIEHEGAVSVSIYALLESGAIFHCADFDLDSDDQQQIEIPAAALRDPNSRMIYFRIRTKGEYACIKRWYFTTSTPSFCRLVEESASLRFPLISRSLINSPTLIKNFLAL